MTNMENALIDKETRSAVAREDCSILVAMARALGGVALKSDSHVVKPIFFPGARDLMYSQQF